MNKPYRSLPTSSMLLAATRTLLGLHRLPGSVRPRLRHIAFRLEGVTELVARRPCAIGHVRAPQRALPASGVPVRKEATDRDWGDCDCAVGSPDGNIVYLRSCSPPYENKMSFNTLGVCERKDPQAGGLGRDQRVPGGVRPWVTIPS